MGNIPDNSEYWAVECDECNEWIALRPANRIKNELLDPDVPFPEEFTVAGHEHSGTFHRAEIRPQILRHRLNKELTKITPIK